MVSLINVFLQRQEQLYLQYLSQLGSDEISELFKLQIKSKTAANIDLVVRGIIEGSFANSDISCVTTIKNSVDIFLNNFRQGEVGGNDSLINHFELFFQPILKEIIDIINQFFSLIHPFNVTSNHFIYHSQELISTKFQELVEMAEYCNLFILEYSIVDEISFYEKLNSSLKRAALSHKKYPFRNLTIYEHKIKFLSYKWLKRRKYDVSILKKHLGASYNEKYVFGNNIVDLDKKVLIGEPYYEVYKDWINKIDFHYFDILEKIDADAFLENVDYNDSYDLHFLVKLYKDYEPNLVELKKLEEYYKKYPSHLLSKNSKQKNLLYFYNNYFSKLVEESNEDSKEIKEKFNEITTIYKNKSNNNFFIYYKYLDLKIKESQKFINEKEIGKINLVYLNDLLSICRNHFEWTKASLNRLYDFDFKNCIVIINNQKVYHPSSFLLALSIDENEQKIKSVESDLQKLETELYYVKNQKALEEVSLSLGYNEKKLTETISIFTAIISFIVGSIGAFKFIETFSQALLFISIFGTSISVFVLLIFASTKGIHAVMKKWYVFLFYPSIFAIMYWIILPSYQADLKRYPLTMQNEKIIQKKLDSLQIINKLNIKKQEVRIDSLKNLLKKTTPQK